MNSIGSVLGVIILALGVLVAPTSADEPTPLPKDLKITTPDSTVPPDVAAFSGRWSGNWEGLLNSTLVVTKIYPNKNGGWRADVVYSWGTYSGWRIDRAGYREYDADFKDGALVVQGGRLIITYRVSVDRGSLAGVWNATRGDYKGTFVKAPSQ